MSDIEGKSILHVFQKISGKPTLGDVDTSPTSFYCSTERLSASQWEVPFLCYAPCPFQIQAGALLYVSTEFWHFIEVFITKHKKHYESCLKEKY